MDEQDFEKLLEMARTPNIETSKLAWVLSKSSDLPKQDKTTIEWNHFETVNKCLETEIIKRFFYPFKKSK